MRQKFDDITDGSAVQTKAGEKVEKNQGAARAISSFIDPSLSWKDLDFFKSITNSECEGGDGGVGERVLTLGRDFWVWFVLYLSADRVSSFL